MFFLTLTLIWKNVKKRVLKLNPDMKIIPISARTGEGMDEWIDWLKEETSSWNESNEKRSKGMKEERKLILKLGQMITDRVGVKVTVRIPSIGDSRKF